MNGTVQVMKGSDGRWRWSWRDDDTGFLSTKDYESRAAALAAARSAYPDAVTERAPERREPAGKKSLAAFLLAALALWRSMRR